MIISWSDNGTRSYSYELSRASRWEKQAGCAGAQRNADFMLEKSGNGAGKEELRSRRRLSDNAKKLPKERERNEEKEATRWRRMRDGKWERMRRWKVYGSERGKVKFCEKKEDAWWYGSCRTRNVVNRGRRNGSSGGTLYLLLALCVTRSLFIFWEWRGTLTCRRSQRRQRNKRGTSLFLLDPYEFLPPLRSAKPADSRLLKRLNRGRKLPPHARISAISLYRIMNVREVVVG